MFTRHEEYSGVVTASAQQAFDLLDDQSRLSAHMSKRSWKMGWGKMEFSFDGGQGRAVGSRIGLHGRAFGISLGLDEIVVTRERPYRKAWETVGEPRLLVIGAYRMGFEIVPTSTAVQLRVIIDYELPTRGVSRWLGRMFGRAYATWCVRQMVRDTQSAFASGGVETSAA